MSNWSNIDFYNDNNITSIKKIYEEIDAGIFVEGVLYLEKEEYGEFEEDPTPEWVQKKTDRPKLSAEEEYRIKIRKETAIRMVRSVAENQALDKIEREKCKKEREEWLRINRIEREKQKALDRIEREKCKKEREEWLRINRIEREKQKALDKIEREKQKVLNKIEKEKEKARDREIRFLLAKQRAIEKEKKDRADYLESEERKRLIRASNLEIQKAKVLVGYDDVLVYDDYYEITCSKKNLDIIIKNDMNGSFEEDPSIGNLILDETSFYHRSTDCYKLVKYYRDQRYCVNRDEDWDWDDEY